MKKAIRFFAFALLCLLFAPQSASAQIALPNNWTVDTGGNNTGLLFIASGPPDKWVILATPRVVASQTVSLAAGQYSIAYSGDPLTVSALPTNTQTSLTPSISTAGVGTPLVTTFVNTPPLNLDFVLLTPQPHTDSFDVTDSGDAIVSFEFLSENCEGSVSFITTYGFCAINFGPSSVVLTLLSLDSLTSKLDPSASDNVRKVAAAIDSYSTDLSAFPTSFANAYYWSNATMSANLSQLTGEATIGGAYGGFGIMRSFLDLFSGVAGSNVSGNVTSYAAEPAPAPAVDALAQATSTHENPPASGGLNLWGAGFAGTSRIDGDASVGSHRTDTHHSGFAVGGEIGSRSGTRLGYAVAGGNANWSLADGLGGGDGDALLLGIYGETHLDAAYVNASFGFANHWMTTRREASGEILTSDFDAQVYAGRIEAGYRFDPAGMLGMTPYGAVELQHYRSAAHDETGGGLALSYDAMSMTDTRTELGLRFDCARIVGDGNSLLLDARAAWVHEHTSDATIGVDFQSLPVPGFTVGGAEMPGDMALASAGAELGIAPNMTLSARLQGEFSNAYRSYAAMGRLRYSW